MVLGGARERGADVGRLADDVAADAKIMSRSNISNRGAV